MKIELNEEDLKTIKKWLHAYWFMVEDYDPEDERLIEKLKLIESEKEE